MVTLGIDAHKRTHTVVAVDEHGRQLAADDDRRRPSSDHLELVRLGGQASVSDALGGRGLPAPLAPAGARPARGRRADRAGAAEADGARPRRRPHLRQVRPDRRARGRPRRAARARPARRPARRAASASCGCWSTTAKTWSPNAPGSSTGLRWHLHELDPGLEPAAPDRSTSPATSTKLAAPPRRRRRHRRPDRPRAHRPLPPLTIDDQRARAPRSPPLVETARPVAARDLRLRAAHRRQDRRRDRRHRPLQQPRRLRPPQRHRTPARLVLQPSTPPAQPHRQPPTQRRHPPHRAHPGPLAPTPPRPCSPAAAPTATAASKHSASSNAASPTSSTAPYAPTQPPPTPRRLTEEQLKHQASTGRERGRLSGVFVRWVFEL